VRSVVRVLALGGGSFALEPAASCCNCGKSALRTHGRNPGSCAPSHAIAHGPVGTPTSGIVDRGSTPIAGSAIRRVTEWRSTPSACPPHGTTGPSAVLSAGASLWNRLFAAIQRAISCERCTRWRRCWTMHTIFLRAPARTDMSAHGRGRCEHGAGCDGCAISRVCSVGCARHTSRAARA
jgi:hypothetical protein